MWKLRNIIIIRKYSYEENTKPNGFTDECHQLLSNLCLLFYTNISHTRGRQPHGLNRGGGTVSLISYWDLLSGSMAWHCRWSSDLSILLEYSLCWLLEIDSGGNIYTMEINKSHKSWVDLALLIVSSLGSRFKEVMETMLIMQFKLKSVSCLLPLCQEQHKK